MKLFKLFFGVIGFLLFSSFAKAQLELIPQLGHQEGIIYTQFSDDGRWLATGGRDRVILLWDMQTGLHWTLTGLSFVVTGMDFNDQSNLLAACDGRGTILVWDIETKEIRYQKDLKKDVGDLNFLPNGKGLLYGASKVFIWDFVQDQTQSTNMPVTSSKSSVSITPDGKQRISTAKTISFASGNLTTTYQSMIANIGKETFDTRTDLFRYGRQWVSNALSPEGDFVAFANDEKILVQNFKTGALIREFSIRAAVRSLYLSKNGTYAVAAYEEGTIAICHTNSGKIDKVGAVVGSEIVNGIAGYDHVNELIVGVDNADHSLNFYDIRTRSIIKQFKPGQSMAGKLAWDDKKRKLHVLNSDAIIVWDMSALKVESRQQFSYRPTESFTKASQNAFTQQTLGLQFGTTLVNGSIQESSKNYYFVNNLDDKRLDIYQKSSNTIFKSVSADHYVTSAAMSLFESKLFVADVFGIKVYNFPDLELIKEFPYERGAPSTMRMSWDGQYLAVGKTSETVWLGDVEKPLEFDVDIYDIAKLSLHKKLQGHYSTTVGMAFTQDGHLFTGSFDGKINYWDYEKGTLLSSMHGTDVDYYYITTTDGYYTLSKTAIDRIAFNNQGDLYPASLFEIKLNRPDKVANTFNYSEQTLVDAYYQAYQKRIKQLGVDEETLDFSNLPKIRITTKNIPRTTKNKNLKFEIEASESKGELAYLQVLVNNVPLFGSGGLKVSGDNLKKTIDLTLSDGLNKITTSVINQNGIESAPAIFETTCATQTQKNLYLLAIGVSQFDDSEYNLTYAAKDAKDLAAFFTSKKQDYAKILVKEVTDQQATQSQIQGYKDFFAKAKVDDEVILFVASHGLLDDNLDYYIATTDMIFEEPGARGIKYSTLEGLLTNTPARNRLLMIDACHSGEVDKDDVSVSSTGVSASVNSNVKSRGFKTVKSNANALGLKNSFELMKEMFADMRNSSGATIISSASGTEFALESDAWKNGVFTYAVINGLKSEDADLDNDDLISVSELKNYVFAEVEVLTGGKQHPTSRIENLQNNFTVASTKAASITKFDPTGHWVNYYSYYGDNRKRYYEIVKNGVDIDVYVEAMEDYSKKWRKSTSPIKYVKIGPNQYRTVSGSIIQINDENSLVDKDMYGNSDFDNLYQRSESGRKVETSSYVAPAAASTVSTSSSSPSGAYPNELSGTWYRTDGKKDSNGTTSSATIQGTAEGISVTLSQSKKTYKYVKKSDGLYEFSLGSLTFKVQKNKDGTLNINKYNFKK